MKKLLSVLLALTLLAGFAACGAPTQSGTPNSSAEPLAVVSQDTTEFTVIYPEGASAELMEAVSFLCESLQTSTGVTFKQTEDMATSADAQRCEILVGATDRSESAQVMGEMSGSGDYAVRVIGKKIVLAGMLDMGVRSAAEKLLEVLTQSNQWTIAGDYSFSGVSNSPIQHLPAYTYGTLQTSYDCGDDADMLIYESDETGLLSYLTDLENAGFTKYTENTIDKNKFFTYTKDGVMVHMMSLPGMKTVRLIAQENAILPKAAPEAVTAQVKPSVTMLGQEGYDTSTGSANQIAMNFIYQLSDGRFIIVDGGNNHDLAADQMMDKLKELAPDPQNIQVAAWFITHAHWDHFGALLKFTEKYAGQLTVDQLICNLPNETEMNGGSETEATNRTRIYDAAAKLGAQIVKAYTGQVFYFGDAVIEILCSVEVVAPQSFEDFNNSSLIFSVDLGGQKLMQLADCGPLQSPILTNIYPTALKSDIVQTGHHGYRGATSELYRAIAPDYMLWPSGSNAYENYKDMDYHVWVLGHVKKTWVARDDIYTLQLPIS